MHHAKLGIVAVSLVAAIVIVLGAFMREDDDTGHVTEADFSAAKVVERPGSGAAVGQGWGTFGATGATSAGKVVDIGVTEDLTLGVGTLRRDEPALTRRSEPGRARRVVPAEETAEVRDPGADSWRLDGAKREGAVLGEEYREAPRGRETVVTSGRHIGTLRVRVPDSADLALALAGRDGAPVRAEVCVSRKGKPTEVRVVDGTGVASVDQRVAQQLLAGRYRPLRRDGRRVEFCERATVIVTGS